MGQSKSRLISVSEREGITFYRTDGIDIETTLIGDINAINPP